MHVRRAIVIRVPTWWLTAWKDWHCDWRARLVANGHAYHSGGFSEMNSALTMFGFLWCFLVAYWAAKWNRSFCGFFVACFFLSPPLPYGMTAASIYKEDECLHAPEVERASFQRQILNGIKIRDQYYLRLFPPSSYSAPPLAITALRTNGNVVSKRGPWVVHSELPMIPKRKFLPKPYRGERRVAHPFHNVRQFWFISE